MEQKQIAHAWLLYLKKPLICIFRSRTTTPLLRGNSLEQPYPPRTHTKHDSDGPPALETCNVLPV